MAEFDHVKSIFGIILGLGLTHLIRGSVIFIQHPGRKKFYLIHFLWVLFVFLLIVHFWWWEINLRLITQWNFAEYIFLIFYILLFYLLCAILYPDDLKDYSSYENYFYSRKNWFFAILAVCFLADLIDTSLKGKTYYLSSQPIYYLRNISHIILCLIAIKISNKKIHFGLVLFFIVFEIFFITQFFSVE